MNTPLSPLADPEIELAISYAPRERRAGLRALWTLDAQLGATLRNASDPMVARLRLTWWYEALGRLDIAPAPRQPLLAALAADVLPQGVSGAALAGMTDGWEALLVPDPLGDDGLIAYAQGRGALFALAAGLLGADPAATAVAKAGRGWALADLAAHVRDAKTAVQARTLAEPLLAAAFERRWPVGMRPIGAVAALARRDLGGMRAVRGAPMRVLRMLRHRITGY